MSFQTDKIGINNNISGLYHVDVSGNLNIDGSIFQRGLPFVGGGGDVAWANDVFGSQNGMVWSNGDGSISTSTTMFNDGGGLSFKAGNGLNLMAPLDSSDCGDIVFYRNNGSDEFARIYTESTTGYLIYRSESDGLTGRYMYHSGNLPVGGSNINNRLATFTGAAANGILNGESGLTYDTTNGLDSTGNITTDSSIVCQEIIITNSSGTAKYKISYNDTTDSLDTIKL